MLPDAPIPTPTINPTPVARPASMAFQPPPPARLKAKVLYDFPGTGSSTEMSLKAGEVIEIVQKGPPGGWSKGVRGAFPTDYVQFLPSEPPRPSNLAANSAVTFEPTPANASVKPASVGGIGAPFGNTSSSTPSVMLNQPSTSKKEIPDLLGLSMPDVTTTVSQQSTKANNISSLFDGLDATPSATTSVSTMSSQPGSNNLFGPTTTVSSTASMPIKPQQPQSNVTANVSQATSSITAIKPTPPANSSNSFVGGTLVNPLQSKTAASSTIKPSEPESAGNIILAIAKYSRAATGPTELSIEKGDTLLVRDTKDANWWYGSIVGKSATGYFPSNYVEIKQAATSPAKPLPKPPDRSAESKSVSTQIKPSAAPSLTKDDNISIPSCCTKVGLLGKSYVFPPNGDGLVNPIWNMSCFLDLFADAYKEQLESSDRSNFQGSAFSRIKNSMEYLVECCRFIDISSEIDDEEIRRTFSRAVNMLKDTLDTMRLIPNHKDDNVRFYTFLVSFMMRVKSLRYGEFLLVPSSWTTEQETENAIFLLIRKDTENTSSNYSVTIINMSNNLDSGIDYHPPAVNTVHGTPLRKVSLDLKNIPDDRIQNTAFWYVLRLNYIVSHSVIILFLS